MLTNPEQLFSFDRFLEAQKDTFEIAKVELTAGQKQSCWIWFIFPQILTNRFSENCTKYALGSVAEAQQYLEHQVLGPRLIELVTILLTHRDRPIDAIMGWNVDSEKLRSSLTLFSLASKPGSVFHQALTAFFEGKGCSITLEKLGASDIDKGGSSGVH
jgi:uncharacterized protein (DUF1810 family)